MTPSRPVERRKPEPGALWPVLLEGKAGITLDPDDGHAPVGIVQIVLTCAEAGHVPPETLDGQPADPPPDAKTVDLWMPTTYARDLIALVQRQIDLADAEAAEWVEGTN